MHIYKSTFSYIELSYLIFWEPFVFPMVTLLAKITANFNAFQIKIVFPSCRCIIVLQLRG